MHLETKHGIIPFFISIIWFDANIFTKISAIVYKVHTYIWHFTQDGELAIGNKTRSNLFHLRYIFWNVWHRCMKCMTQTCARWLPLSLYFWFWFGAKVVGVWIDQSVQSQIQKVWIPMFELISPTGHHQPHNKYRKCEFVCNEHFGCERNPDGLWHHDFQRLQYECTGWCCRVIMT